MPLSASAAGFRANVGDSSKGISPVQPENLAAFPAEFRCMAFEGEVCGGPCSGEQQKRIHKKRAFFGSC